VWRLKLKRNEFVELFGVDPGTPPDSDAWHYIWVKDDVYRSLKADWSKATHSVRVGWPDPDETAPIVAETWEEAVNA
jgi:hypothetical protein